MRNEVCVIVRSGHGRISDKIEPTVVVGDRMHYADLAYFSFFSRGKIFDHCEIREERHKDRDKHLFVILIG